MSDAQSQLKSSLEELQGLTLFIAYNANVDALIQVDADIGMYLDRPGGVPGETEPPNRLTSKRDLATAITHSMKAGEGDEIAMIAELAAQLEAELIPDRRQMGGQAGIMTNLLSSLGATPVVYTYLLSETQLSMFERLNAVRFPVVEDDRVRFVSISDAINTDRTKINWIFEFEKGTDLFGVRAEENTRFIAASRPPEFDLTADGLDPIIDQVGTNVEGALLAGYHNLTQENVDTDYEQALNHARNVLRRLRSGGNLPIHIEYAVTHDDDLRLALTELILPEADVVGIDTHELHFLCRDLGIRPTPRDHLVNYVSGDTEAMILDDYRMLAAVRDHLGVPCIRMHAMDYHLAVVDDYLPVDSVRRGLEFAGVTAAAKAATGNIASPQDLERGLEYDPSDAGRVAIESLADDTGASTKDGTLCTPTVVAVPNRVVEDPAGTVGIGDVVSSASFALEVALTRDCDGGECE